MKSTEVVYLARRRPASERELIRIELDRVDAPDDALARKLLKRNLAAEVAAEFQSARRRP